MTNKRNIVLVINDLKGNGAERVVITLATGFTEAGHRASIVCFKDHIELPIPSNIPVHIFSEKYFRWIPRSIRGRLTAPFLDRFIRNKIGLPDLLLSNLMPSDRILGYSRLANVFFVIHSTIHQEVKNYYPTKIKRELSIRKKLYSRKPTIAVSKGVEDSITKLLGKSRNFVTQTIYNPIDANLILESAKSNPIDIVPDAILHVGKFNQAKRQDKLIRAYYNSRCPYPLVFIGKGPLLEEAKDLVTELGLDKNVHFLGFRKNPYPYIKAARLLILCSDFEGLPTVLIEALALNKPAISTNCNSGPREILRPINLCENTVNGLSLKLKDAAREPNKFKTPLSEEFEIQKVTNAYLLLADHQAASLCELD